MNENLEQRIIDLAEEARCNWKVFVFGGEVYTPNEGESAMLAHADEDIDGQNLTEDEYIERQRACMTDRKDGQSEFGVSFDNGLTTKKINDLTNEEIETVWDAIYAANNGAEAPIITEEARDMHRAYDRTIDRGFEDYDEAKIILAAFLDEIETDWVIG